MDLFSKSREDKPLPQSTACDDHATFFRLYLARLAEAGQVSPGEKQLTLIARSPDSAVCRALGDVAPHLAEFGVCLRAIFAHISPEDSFLTFCDSVSSLFGPGGRQEGIRWAKNPALLDAHEQLILGQRMCWSGDAMHRAPERRNALDLFETDKTGAVRFGALAFEAMWSAASPVPEARFAPAMGRPSAGYAPLGAMEAKFASLFSGAERRLTRH